jgi:hypothetical protein
MGDKFRSLSKSFEQTHTINNSDIIIVLLIFAILVVVIILIYNYYKKNYNVKIYKDHNINKKNYNSLAKSVQLSGEQSKILLDFLVKFKFKYPLTCFTNSKVLDEVLRKGLHSIEDNKSIDEKGKNYKNFLLLDIKRKIDSSLRNNIGIKSSHFISENQKIVVFARGKGYFYASVIRNSKDYLIVEIISKKVQKKIFSLNDFLKVYFWREDDAGYTFETEVIGFGNNVRSYLLKHSSNLVRSQKRKYRRVPVNIISDIYSVYSTTKGNKKSYSVSSTVKKGNIINISSGGLKIRTDGIEGNEKYLKIIFTLNKYNIESIGKIVRLYQYEDIKEITVQFVKISLENVNIINKFVYKYLPGY